MVNLRKKIEAEVFDYQALLNALGAYAAPRDKVTALLRSGEIIRVKKGLYVFGEDGRRRPYCRELLANLVYGPSFVSLDYALAYYGMIPEKVEALTSVTTKRSRRFDTPLGMFIYRPTPFMAAGFTRIADGKDAYLIALPERALADKIRGDRSGGGIKSMHDAQVYLTENLRIEMDALLTLDTEFLRELAGRLRSRKVDMCAGWIEKMG